MWFVPPDPDRKWEMRVAVAVMGLVQLVKTAASVRSLEGLILYALALYLVMMLVVCLILLVVGYVGLTRLAVIYRRRAFASTRQARILQGALGLLVVIWAIAYLLTQQDGLLGVGLDLFALSLLAFVITCEVVEWRASRTQPAVAVPQDISLQNIISWNKAVAASKPGSKST